MRPEARWASDDGRAALDITQRAFLSGADEMPRDGCPFGWHQLTYAVIDLDSEHEPTRERARELVLRVWNRHADDVMLLWTRERPGSRPAVWWKLFATGEFAPRKNESEARYLDRHKLLGRGERTRVPRSALQPPRKPKPLREPPPMPKATRHLGLWK